MFSIDTKYQSISTVPYITDNETVFYFDEYPILFSGVNVCGNKVIGSLMYEDDENDTFRYIHLLVTSEQYFDFINQKTTYFLN